MRACPETVGNVASEEGSSSVATRCECGSTPATTPLPAGAYRTETVPGTDRAAERKASRILTRLLAEIDTQRAPTSSVSVEYVLGEWLRAAELEKSTRRTYVGYIDRMIVPAIGSVGIDKLTARMLETFYGELRRCRRRCGDRPLHRAACDRLRPRLRGERVRATCLQADGGRDRPPDQFDHQRRTDRSRAMGVDQLEPGAHCAASTSKGARARPADSSRGGATVGCCVRNGRGLGNPRPAGDDHRYAPR